MVMFDSRNHDLIEPGASGSDCDVTIDPPAGSDDRSRAPQEQAEILFLNQFLPQYQILERLGSGGQGVVYRAVQAQTGRLVALKVMHADASASPRRCQRFEREVEIVARLRHQHVITVFESGMVAGRPYLSMELVEGLPIDDYILLHRPRVEDVIVLVEKVCRAVASVHQRGVIHRDLKPSNILVDLEGEPHILDFGLAKCFDDDANAQSLSAAGQVVGTLAFLSPEQAAADENEVDSRTDVYSLGVILYLLLTGAMPYDVTGTPEEVKREIERQTPIKPHVRGRSEHVASTHSEIPQDLSHVVLKALAKERERRYQSADALADDLRRCLTHDIVQARADSRWYVLRRAARRYRVHLSLAAAFLVLIIAGLISSLVLWQRAENAARLAQVGVQMGAYARLASVQRDEGRVDQAMALCRMTIEFGEQVRNPDAVVNRLLYAAHHSLALDYLKRPGEMEECLKHTAAASRIANELSQAHPEEPEYRRMLAFAKRLNGRIAANRSDWPVAEAELKESADLFMTLTKDQPPGEDAAPIVFEAAKSQQILGRVLLKSGRLAEGMRLLEKVQAIMSEVCAAYPDSMDFLLDLISTEDIMVEHLLRGKTREQNDQAAELLVRIDARLKDAFDRRIADRRLRAVTQLVDAVEQHKEVVNMRIAARKNHVPATQSGSSSPSGDSTGSPSPSIGPSSMDPTKE